MFGYKRHMECRKLEEGTRGKSGRDSSFLFLSLGPSPLFSPLRPGSFLSIFTFITTRLLHLDLDNPPSTPSKMDIDDNASIDSGDAGVSNNNKYNLTEDDNTIVEIAADGDLIMAVGPKKKNFRLHSLILKMTSKVFRAMLGPNFAEGQQLIANVTTGSRKPGLPGKINLPEDDVKSMGFIFKTLHHQFDALESPEDIPFFDILIAADKYDLIAPIKHAFPSCFDYFRC